MLRDSLKARPPPPPPPAHILRKARATRICQWVEAVNESTGLTGSNGEYTCLDTTDIPETPPCTSSLPSTDTPSGDPSHDLGKQAQEAITDIAESTTSTSSSSLPMDDTLLGEERDALRPSLQAATQAFNSGRGIWLGLMNTARALPKDHLPAISISDMLHDIPALPEKIPKHDYLTGHSVWRITEAHNAPDDWHRPEDGATVMQAYTRSLSEVGKKRDIKEPSSGLLGRDWDSHLRHGTEKGFILSFDEPIRCLLSSTTSNPWEGSRVNHSLLILTLCWSYILSVQLYELQGKQVSYSRHALQPQRTKPDKIAGTVNIHVPKTASYDLVQWLCAVLAPEPGWLADDSSFAPWAALYPNNDDGSANVSFTVSTDWALEPGLKTPPPSCVRAMELLFELSCHYGLGHAECTSGSSQALPPYTAAFLAALALPFYRLEELEPQFPSPSLSLQPEPVSFEPIPQAHLRYYMTLSMHSLSLGSTLWSIFWEPGVECNVVGPWLASILSVLRSALESRDTGLLAQVFSLRRPRIALWCIGIFLLGRDQIPSMIARYLETLEERWGYGSLACPDSVAASWTGEPQSFMDIQETKLYLDPEDLVPIAEVLRHRSNFRLQDGRSTPLAWRPFGRVPKGAVEPELWPGLEHGSLREYSHWVWWLEGRGVVSHGFRHDMGRAIAAPIRCAKNSEPHPTLVEMPSVNAAPSIAATERMMWFCMWEATGDRDRDISIIPGAKTHTWLRGWRGFE